MKFTFFSYINCLIYYLYSHGVAPHLQPPTQASIPTSHPKPAGIIEKRLPAPLTTRAGGADRDGHPCGVKVRGGGRRAEEEMGASEVHVMYYAGIWRTD